MLSYSSDSGWIFSPIMAIIVVLVLGYHLFWYIRRRTRKRTLTYENGWYVWIAFDGSEQRSQKNPEEKGGDWYEESHSDGDGFGDGDGGD